MPLAAVAEMKAGLNRGENFASLMQGLGFSSSLVTQLSLAEQHGNVEKSLGLIHSYLSQVQAVKKKLIEVSTYPILLLLFLILIMLGLKNYLLPQLGDQSFLTHLIGHFPTIFLGLILLFGLILGVYLYKWKHSSHLLLFQSLVKVPFLSYLVKTYLTAYFSREWGNLLSQGLEMDQVVGLMQDQSFKLFRELGQDLDQALSAGQDFAQALKDYPFFRPELSLIIEFGQVKSKLGQELEIYSETVWQDFFSQVNRWMNVIQPLVFVFVAFMIVLLYAAMLLPIYQNMGAQL